MLITLIAAGVIATSGAVIEPGHGDVVVPAGALALVPAAAASGATADLPLGAIALERPFDPSDRAPYGFDWTSLLDTAETVDDIDRITVSALGASLGVMVDPDPERVPMIDPTHKRVGFWPIVSPAFQGNAAFAGAGTKVGISILIRTTAEPYRAYERTAILTVRQL